MKDQYVGDVGDFVKVALLRSITPGHKLGILWYRTRDEPKKKDGRFIAYLHNPDRWRDLDALAYEHLRKIVSSNRRQISALEDRDLLPECQAFWDVEVPCTPAPRFSQRPIDREAWFTDALRKMNEAGCNIVFVDPDNGIEPPGCRNTQSRATKYVLSCELRALLGHASNRRTIVAYHHNTRRRGGHCEEIRWLQDELQQHTNGRRPMAVRARSHSPRTFFILHASAAVTSSTLAFADRWRNHGVELFE
jgi:hypothetical protein